MKIIFISIFLIVFSSTTNNVRGVLIGGNISNGTQIVGSVTVNGPLEDDIGRNINNGGGTQIIKALNVKNGMDVTDEEEANTSDEEMGEAWGRSEDKGFSEKFKRNDSDNEDTEGNSSNDSEIEKGAKAKDVRPNSKNKGISESTRGSDFERKFDHKDSDSEGNESNSSNDSGIEKEAKETDDKNSGGGDVQEKTGQPTRNYWKYLKKVPMPFLNTFRNSFKGNSEDVPDEERPSQENVLVPNTKTDGGNQHIAPVTFGEGPKGNQIGGNDCSGAGEQNIAPVTLGDGTEVALVGNNQNSGGKQTIGAVTIRRS